MISISSYNEKIYNSYKTYSISGDRGKGVNYRGKCYPALAPKLSFFKIWHSNIGIIKEEENNKFYIEEYYKQVLSQLDPEEVYKKLDNSILLCYEPSDKFCHRFIVAAWFELFLDIYVPEVKIVNNKLEIVERPEYIKDCLEEIIKNNTNMRGFNSLRALYLFEEGEKLEAKANKLEEKTGKCYDNYRQAACFLRCDADEAEEKYNIEKLVKKKTKTQTL